MIPSFAKNGVLDLKVGVVKGVNQQIDLDTGEIGIHSTPAVVGDIIIVGSSFREGATVATHNNTKGLVRAFDVRTGKLLWRFNTIPNPGDFGHETWLNDSWAINGNVGVWTQISVDEQLGLVYLPVETPSSDHYGGHRPGDNLFAESLRVCRSEDRQAEVAFSVRPSSAVEPRHVLGAAAGRHHRRRTRDQGGRGAQQAELPVRVRSRDRPARVADRRTARAGG